jgi:hypothetical protein
MERFIDAGRGLEEPPYLALQRGRSFTSFSTAAGAVLAGTRRQLGAGLPGLPAIAGGLASFAGRQGGNPALVLHARTVESATLGVNEKALRGVGMGYAELNGKYQRLRSELDAAYARPVWNSSRIDEIAEQMAELERALASVQSEGGIGVAWQGPPHRGPERAMDS